MLIASLGSKINANLAKIMSAVERLVSQLSLIKSKHRASLKQECLLAQLQAEPNFKEEV